MTVYTNKYRRAFLKDRSLTEMIVAALAMFLFILLMGLACFSDYLDRLEVLKP